MNKLTAVKIKYSDGTYSDEIPVAALAENVEWDNSHSLVDILGEVAFDTKGTIQDQITQISNSKVDSTDLNNYVNSTMKTEVTNWLSSYISPATGTILYDASLSIEGAAADAKAAGEIYDDLNGIAKTILDTENIMSWQNGYSYVVPSSVSSMSIDGYTQTTNFACTYVECKQGDTFYLTGLGGSGSKLWIFTKDNGGIISRSEGNIHATNTKLTAPPRAKYLLVNVDIREKYSLFFGNSINDRIEKSYETNASTISLLSGFGLVADWIDGFYIRNNGDTVDVNSPVETWNFSYIIKPCVGGERFVVTGSGGSGGRLWSFVDNNGNVLKKSESEVTSNNLVLVAPINSAYLIVNVNNQSNHSLYRGAILSDIYLPTYNTVGDMMNDLTLEKGKCVKTLCYSPNAGGMGATYKIVDSGFESTGYEMLKNGLYAIPLLDVTQDNNKPTNDLQSMIRTAITYQQSGVSFTYAKDASTGISYPTAVDSGFVDGTYYIDCSTLSYLILNGVAFENSRYAGQSTNIRQSGAFYMNDIALPKDTRKIRSAYQQALYLSYMGKTYKPNSDYSNIRTGDIVFFSNGTHSDKFMNIDHVAIYLGTYGTNASGSRRHLFIGNNGDSTDREIKTFFYCDTESYFRKIVLCGGIGVQINHCYSYDNIVVDGYTEKTKASGSTLTSAYDVVKKIKSHTGYTVFIETDVVPLEMRFMVGNSVRSEFFLDAYSIYTLYPSEKRQKYYLVTGDVSASDNDKKLRIGANSNDVFTIQSLEVYEGWV